MKLLLMLTNVIIIRFTLITICTLPSSCTCTRITIDLVCTSTSIDTRITDTLVDICKQERCLSSRIVLPSTIKGLANTSVHMITIEIVSKIYKLLLKCLFSRKKYITQFTVCALPTSCTHTRVLILQVVARCTVLTWVTCTLVNICERIIFHIR